MISQDEQGISSSIHDQVFSVFPVQSRHFFFFFTCVGRTDQQNYDTHDDTLWLTLLLFFGFISPCLPSCANSEFVTSMQQKPDFHAVLTVCFQLLDHVIQDNYF